MTQASQDVIVMVDIETLGMQPNAVIWQAAFMAVPKSDPNPINAVKFDSFYLPIQPQLDMGRTIDASTLGFWLKQPDKSRLNILEAIDGDLDELTAFVRSFIRKILAVTSEADSSEIWAQGPQFDIVKLESLMHSLGEDEPWHYRDIQDLRTLARQHGVSKDDVDSSDIIPHVALEDIRLQLRVYEEVMRRINEVMPA